jgi:hypothetical protein
MMFKAIFFFIFTLNALTSLAIVFDPDHRGNCHLGLMALNCQVALFSDSKRFNVKAKAHIFQSLNFCDYDVLAADSELQNFDGASIAVVKRGDCAFAVKVRNAEKIGFAGLVIVNKDDDIFPIGMKASEPQPTIPVVLIDTKIWEYLSKVDEKDIDNLVLTISYERARTVPVEDIHETRPIQKQQSIPSKPLHVRTEDLFDISSYVKYIAYSLLALSVILTSAYMFKAIQTIVPNFTKNDAILSSKNSSSSMLFHFFIVIFVSFFIILRLGTLRIYASLNTKEVLYNHNETDERIFEVITVVNLSFTCIRCDR